MIPISQKYTLIFYTLYNLNVTKAQKPCYQNARGLHTKIKIKIKTCIVFVVHDLFKKSIPCTFSSHPVTCWDKVPEYSKFTWVHGYYHYYLQLKSSQNSFLNEIDDRNSCRNKVASFYMRMSPQKPPRYNNPLNSHFICGMKSNLISINSKLPKYPF